MSRRPIITPLEEARIAVIRDALHRDQGQVLDQETLTLYASRGISKANLERAIAIMVERGEAVLVPCRWGVGVRLLERGK